MQLELHQNVKYSRDNETLWAKYYESFHQFAIYKRKPLRIVRIIVTVCL